LIAHAWPAPTRPEKIAPSLQLDDRPPIVVPLLGPAPAVAASEDQCVALTKLANVSHGIDRIAVLDRLAQATESEVDDSFDNLHIATATIAYKALLAEPGLDRYPKGDEVLYRAGRMLEYAGRFEEGRTIFDRLIHAFPHSKLVVDAYLTIADATLEPATAEPLYEQAILLAHGAHAFYARERLATIYFRLGRHQDALALFAEVATKADEPLREVAARDAVEPYAEIGRPELAREFFRQLDLGNENALSRALAMRYLQTGMDEKAIRVIETLGAETDPDATCADRVVVFRARLDLGDRLQTIEAAQALVEVAQEASTACRGEVDGEIADTAFTWQIELLKSEDDPALVVKLWDLAIRVATTPSRRAVALRDRAYLAWSIARSAAEWRTAAEAMQEAADETGDRRFATGAADARANAAAVTRR
jgi:tetratricopeptide (TPR) repeat protein